MVAKGEVGEFGHASWPTPDGSTFVDANEQIREWRETTQPEALAAQLTETVEQAFHALNFLAMFNLAYPESVFENAMAQLPPERAELFKDQLELSKIYSRRSRETRGTKESPEGRLFNLAMRAASLNDPSEQTTS